MKKFEAYGIKGMDSKKWRKVFKSQEQFEAWLAKNENEVEVYGFRDIE